MAKIISSPVRLSFWMCFIERTKDTVHPHENEEKELLIAICRHHSLLYPVIVLYKAA